jgi:hypothetical protein
LDEPGSRIPFDKQVEGMVLDHLHAVLVDFAGYRGGSWFYSLSSLTDEVEKMIRNRNVYLNLPVLVLELGPSHPFWEGMFEISGE